MSSLPEEGSLLEAVGVLNDFPSAPGWNRAAPPCVLTSSSKKDSFFFFFPSSSSETQTQVEVVTIVLWALPSRSVPPAQHLACVSGQVRPLLTGAPAKPAVIARVKTRVQGKKKKQPKGTEPFTNCLQTVSKGVVAVQCK